MNIKQKIAALLIVPIVMVTGVIAFSATTHADNSCGTETAILKCDPAPDGAQEFEKTGLWRILLQAVNILTALAGLAALGGIIYGAVLYTSAGGSPEQVKKAMGVFTNTVIGVIAFAIMYVGLNFLIPGGVFK